jgi:hypothetical protein
MVALRDAARPPCPRRPIGHDRGPCRERAEDLADLADGAAAAIGDHRRRQGGAVAAIFLVDVLDDLLAPLVLEVDVDVGWLVALELDMKRSNSTSDLAGFTSVMPRQ